MQKAGKIALKVVIIVVAVIVALLLLVRAVDGIAFASFYSNAEVAYAMPGVLENYVPQGYDYDEEKEIFLTTGYMSDKTASRVYVIEPNGNAYYTQLKKQDGSDYTGHTGGIIHYGDYAYITGANGLDVFSYADIVSKDVSETKRLGTVLTYNDPAHCYIYNGYVFAGSFFIENDYETPAHERVTTPAGDENTSIITVFKLNDSKDFCIDPTPRAVLSTRRCVQGMCFTDEGKIVLSTSYGLSASQLFVYDPSELVGERYDFVGTTSNDKEFAFNGIQRFYLDSACLVDTITAPPMSEELVFLDNKIYVMNESACNKYIFGKFTTGLNVYAYKYDK